MQRLLFLSLALAVACGESTTIGGADGGDSGGTELGGLGDGGGLDAGGGGMDAGVDLGMDAGVDLGTDAGTDLGVDLGTDMGVDMGDPGACSVPGAIEEVPCGLCGTRQRFCLSTGRWDEGECLGEGVCEPGSVEAVACGNCGLQERFCDVECAWVTRGECAGEGVCAPGDLGEPSEMGCTAPDIQTPVCSDLCAFEAGMCLPRPAEVFLLLDTTGSMGTVITGAAADFTRFFGTVTAARMDVRVGLATYQDFPTAGFGGGADRPFEGVLVPTGDPMAFDLGFASIGRRGGGDLAESGIEALATLAGRAPHPDAVPFTCAAGTDPGGCWQPLGDRVVVVVTDVYNHRGPEMLSGTDYPALIDGVAPATWADAQAELRAAGIALRVVYVAALGGATEGLVEWETMVTDLGGDPMTDIVVGRREATPPMGELSFGGALDAMAALVAAELTVP